MYVLWDIMIESIKEALQLIMSGGPDRFGEKLSHAASLFMIRIIQHPDFEPTSQFWADIHQKTIDHFEVKNISLLEWCREHGAGSLHSTKLWPVWCVHQDLIEEPLFAYTSAMPPSVMIWAENWGFNESTLQNLPASCFAAHRSYRIPTVDEKAAELIPLWGEFFHAAVNYDPNIDNYYEALEFFRKDQDQNQEALERSMFRAGLLPQSRCPDQNEDIRGWFEWIDRIQKMGGLCQLRT